MRVHTSANSGGFMLSQTEPWPPGPDHSRVLLPSEFDSPPRPRPPRRRHWPRDPARIPCRAAKSRSSHGSLKDLGQLHKEARPNPVPGEFDTASGHPSRVRAGACLRRDKAGTWQGHGRDMAGTWQGLAAPFSVGFWESLLEFSSGNWDALSGMGLCVVQHFERG